MPIIDRAVDVEADKASERRFASVFLHQAECFLNSFQIQPRESNPQPRHYECGAARASMCREWLAVGDGIGYRSCGDVSQRHVDLLFHHGAILAAFGHEFRMSSRSG